MTRLSDTTLGLLAAGIQRPAYDRAATKSGVVHLGIGAFHRAHQAVYFEHALSAGDLRWGITGASLRSPEVRAQLVPQDGLYTLVERDGAGERLQVIGAVRDVIVGTENPASLVAALAAPETHIVTLTVTEKGYQIDPQFDSLRTDDDRPVNLSAPRTAPEFIATALAVRRARGLAPFTAISCDNLPSNGQRLATAVIAIARARDAGLADWIEAEGAFPETMVDRIVPATDAADLAAVGTRIGLDDRAMVKTEPFLQWVVQDRFCGPRPDLEAAGVQLAASVAPWEAAKLRMLNGAHSGLAYLGGLAGITFVHEMIARAPARQFVEALWNEAATTLSPPPGLDVAVYRDALMARFANPALQHRTRQIAMDGSQKLPQRLLASIAERRAREMGVEALALAVAAWMRWQDGRDDSGTVHLVDDPLAPLTAARLAGVHGAAERVDALLSIREVFPDALSKDDEVRRVVARHLARLQEHGALAAMEMLSRADCADQG